MKKITIIYAKTAFWFAAFAASTFYMFDSLCVPFVFVIIFCWSRYEHFSEILQRVRNRKKTADTANADCSKNI